MGGNALKHCTSRISKEDYSRISKQTIQKLMDMFGCSVVAPPEISRKDSYGDIDLLINRWGSDYLNRIIKEFDLKENEYVKNSNVLSFKVESAQVDLSYYDDSIFQCAYTYFSYNDLWNLIGRLGHKLGLKVAHDGIKLTIRPTDVDNHVISEIVLSTDLFDVLQILGLDVSKYGKFCNYEDMFMYVSTSKYFNPDIFLLDNRNAKSRIRDKKRKVYNLFLEWTQKQNDLNMYQFESVNERGGYNVREPYFTDVIVPYFGIWVKEEMEKQIEKYLLKKQYNSLFDGIVIGDIFGVSGKDLGSVIANLKDQFPDMRETVSKYSKEDMIDYFKSQRTMING